MSYLSMRMREIRKEEARRADRVVMIDPGMERFMDRAYVRYGETLLAPVPRHLGYRNRGG